jgi:hypothetical protein
MATGRVIETSFFPSPNFFIYPNPILRMIISEFLSIQMLYLLLIDNNELVVILISFK